jgi:hypothetical protein
MFNEGSVKALPQLVSTISPLAPMAYASLVGALSLFHANSHKIPSIEGLAHLAACGVATGSSRATPQVIKRLVQLAAQWSGGADDPAEAPTMVTIATGWGDYRVFTSDPHTGYRMSCLIAALARGNFPPELKRKAIAALALSEAMAERASIDSPDTLLNTIYVPSNAQLRKATDAVTFTDQELAAVVSGVGCTVEDLKDIILPYGQRPPTAFPQMGDRLQEQTPLLRTAGKTVVYAPRFLSLAALNTVIKHCPADARLALSLAYHEQILNRVTRCLRVLGHREIAHINVGTVEGYAITSSLRWTCDRLRQLTTTVLTELLPVCPLLGDTWRIPDPIPAPPSRRPIDRCGVGDILYIFVFAHLARWPHAEITPSPNERILTLRADELEAVCHARLASGADADWNLELWRYYEAISTMGFTGFAFTFLDQYAMWRSREQRIIQGLEEPPDLLGTQPGFGIVIRKEALKTAPTARAFRQRNIVLIMVPMDQKSLLYAPYFPDDEFVWYMHSVDMALWFTAEASTDPGFLKLTRTVAFWLPRLPSAVRSVLIDTIHYPAHIEWALHPNDASVAATSSLLERTIVVCISEEFWRQISATSNTLEIELIRIVARELLLILGRSDLVSELERFVAEMLQHPLRRTLHALQNDNHPGLMFHERLPALRRISLHDRAMVRRSAAAAMVGATSPTHSAVEALFIGLEAEVRGHDASAALRTLMEHIEAFAADQDFRAATDSSLRAFDDFDDDTANKRDENALRAQAVRYLVELVAVTNGSGRQCLPDSTLDRWTAVSAELINLGTLGDIQHFKLSDDTPKVGKLDYTESLGSYGRATSVVERALAAEFKLSSPQIESRLSGEQIERLNMALGKELGVTFERLVEFRAIATRLANDQGLPIVRMSEESFHAQVALRLHWTTDVTIRFLESFAIRPRISYTGIPPTWNKSDIHPWRLNREASYIRRPVIWGTANSIWFGPGHVARSNDYVLQLCLDGRFKAHTRELKSVMGEITGARNEAFNDVVAERLAKCGYKTFSRMEKFNRQKLAGPEGDLGDVDVIAVDNGRKKIWALECKDFLLGRSPHEVVNDLTELFRSEGGKRKTVQQKMLARTAWLRGHINDVMAHLGLRGSGWKIADAIIFSRPLLSPLLGQAQIPVLVFAELRGRGCLENARSPR